ncbi:hypothetical protein KRZ98_13395 [Sphingobium sp. AS12]|uniref:WcbI family polysaccharide biosynthesis putative acetyltransferase n=1 Tax=Sphingobium sp. AS12 TaxID=2849495 RepID=UPI001C312E01|nr:hypothetical protein [Sphingobium sp. AS12]
MKIAIVGNCQARTIHRAMVALAPNHEFELYHMNRIQRACPVRDDIESWASEVALSDVACLINYLPKSGLFSEAALLPRCKHVVRFPYIAFTGFHPDCVYLTANGTQLTGPAGPYHSAIVFAAWSLGIPEHYVPSLFNRFTFKSLNLQAFYDAAVAKQGSEWSALGYNFSEFLSLNRSFMHTVNHPAVDILIDTARQALRHIGIQPTEVDIDVEDELSEAVIWPVYDGLLKDVNSSPNFMIEGKEVPLRDFVTNSYQAYEDHRGVTIDGHGVEAAKQFLTEHYVYAAKV